ncbi:MAG: amidohydrolase family protein [Myxococcota bacterium]
MHDLVLRGGQLVDGSGGPARVGDLAISGGRIAAIGPVAARGREELDASGCWVTPGFVDPHTHLDAQLCWDPSGSPSNAHGVTTVVIGLCGFGVAPCPPGGEAYLLRALEVVEEIPYASTRRGVPFGWRSWRDYRDFLDAQPLGVNVAGFVPHSALRHAIMGERARHDVATSDEREAMVKALREALAAGAVGFATSRGPNHVDAFGGPVPSRVADAAELEALVRACRGRIWQINVATKFSRDATALIAEIEGYAAWTRAAGARMTWTPFYAEPGEDVWRDVLAHNERLNASGARVAPQVTAVPITLLLRFDERSVFTAIEGWQAVLHDFDGRDPDGKKRLLADPAVRSVMKRGGGDPKNPLTPDFGLWTFTRTPSRPERAGRSLAEIARGEGAHPVDLLCDQILSDDLATLVDVPILNRSAEGAARLVGDERTLLGLGDSGAHVTSVTNYRYPTYLLETLVNEQRRMAVETAVHRMTQVPARLHGLRDRGLLAPGRWADVCVIDSHRIGLGPVEVAHDLPDGAPRLVQSGRGFRAVFVNGVATIRSDRPTGRRPGRMLRAEA